MSADDDTARSMAEALRHLGCSLSTHAAAAGWEVVVSHPRLRPGTIRVSHRSEAVAHRSAYRFASGQLSRPAART